MADRTEPAWVNFYRRSQPTAHQTRKQADGMAMIKYPDDERIACAMVRATVGAGINQDRMVAP